MINLGYKKYLQFNKKKSIISVSTGKNPLKRLFEIKKKKLKLFKGKDSTNKLFQINGNFYFASVNFINKYKSFFKEGISHPVILNSKKFSIDIDTFKDFKKAKEYLQNS